MRIAIVGGGLAGALLAYRLRQGAPRTTVEVYTGPPVIDATGASGGLVRGFEEAAGACRAAAASLAELRDSATLRTWARYREVGSIYLLPPGTDPAGSVAVVEQALPGSVAVVEPVAGQPFQELPAGTIAIVERHAGYLSPDALRSGVLAELAATGTVLRPDRVAGVSAGPAVRLAGVRTAEYDVVVVAAGPWTPRLLRDSGLTTGLRTKLIQYAIYRAQPRWSGAFVDETTGLYGRPFGEGRFLLGLPTPHWDVDPAAVTPDPSLAEEIAVRARLRFGIPVARDHSAGLVASTDCYHDPPGLALRRCLPGTALFTFTGGSGGAAKTAIAASRAAASTLLAL
jgi:glycine/D-amino acid oxidase-like deaminating enzyme